jgi:hypothetical protein
LKATGEVIVDLSLDILFRLFGTRHFARAVAKEQSMAKIVSNQPHIVQVRNDDVELARRRNPKADADTHEALAVALAALRNVHIKSRDGLEAVKMIARMLPVEMQKKLPRELAKAH